MERNAEPTKAVMTSREVAEILRIHPYTVNALIRSGKLKAFKVSNRYRIQREALQEFMETKAADNEED